MNIVRRRLIAVVIGGAVLGGVLHAAGIGPGDPPVLVLPSARPLQKPTGVIPVQATTPALPVAKVPKLEMLPPPTPQPPIVPPLIVSPVQPLRLAQPTPTLTPKEPVSVSPKVAAKEVAPTPRAETPAVAAKPLEVLPPPSSTGPIPSRLATPGESTMPLRSTVAAAALTAMIAAPAPAAAPQVPATATDYAKTDDVKALKAEIESVRKEITALTGSGVKGTDVTALKTEIETLRKEITTLTGSAVKGTDVKALQDEVAALKKELASHAARTNKDELDALKKDVAALNSYLRETLEGKVDAKGFTHDGVGKQLAKVSDSLNDVTKKLTALETKVNEQSRVAGSSPITRGEEKPLTVRGTVRIVNEYPVEIAIVVNGASHRLEPNSKKDVAVAVGSFKYQLLTSGGTETERSIKDNETVTLTIR